MDERKLHAVASAGAVPARGPISLNDFNRKNAEAYLPHVGDLLAYASEVQFLVPGAIPRGNIVIVAGEPFGGKTWLTYALAYAVASGTPWLGRGAPAVQGPVVILNYDQPTETMGVRVRDIGITADMPVYVHTFGLTKPPSANLPEMLMLPTQESRLKSAFEHIKPVLIIVDSLRQSNNMDENSNKDMAALMAIFKKWQRFNNTTVALIHHTAKSKEGSEHKSTARGSGEIIASADVVIKLEEMKATWTKSRSWNIGKTKDVTVRIADQYLDAPEDADGDIALVKRVNVVGDTPLPGEIDAIGVAAVVEALRKRGWSTFADLKKIGVLEDAVLKEALRNARLKHEVKFVRTKAGRGYVLNEAPP